jgi:hypothetical protein
MGFLRDFSDSIRLGFAKMLASQDVEVTDFGEMVNSKKIIEDANLSAEEINMLEAASKNSDAAGKDMNKKQAGSVVLHASDMVINAKTKLGFLLKRGRANRRLRDKLEENMPKTMTKAKEPAVRLPKDKMVQDAEATNNGTNYGFKKELKTEPRKIGGKYRDSRTK